MESGGNGQTHHRLELVRVGKDLHHDLGSLSGGHLIVHEVGRGQIHKVIIGEEDRHIVGRDAKAGGIRVWVRHGCHESELALDELLEESAGHHVVTAI